MYKAICRLFFVTFLYTLFFNKGGEAYAQTSSQIFIYTGANQTFVVPPGVTCINVQAWGGGGGGGGGDNNGGSAGGGGAYSSNTFSVVPGTTLTVIVGGGGGLGDGCFSNATGGAGAFGFGNGGAGGNSGFTGCSGAGGGGGGGTGILNGGTTLLVAGGGGGGGGGGDDGGGAVGGGGGVDGSSANGASFGAAGSSTNSDGVAGIQTTGSPGDGAGGGGGGGGLIGGGGGGVPGTDFGGSGGGGGTSSSVGSINGSGQTPGNSAALAGICATCASGGNGSPPLLPGYSGNNGVLVINYTSLSVATSASCGVATATATPSGRTVGYTYTWTPLGGNAAATTNLDVSGIYTVTSTDANGCTATATTTIIVPPGLNMLITGPVNPYCDTNRLDWVNWSTITATSGIGNVSSNLSISLTKPTGGLSTTSSLYNSSTFPTQYNLPVNNTTLKNTSAGVFTFCFSKPVIDPQVAFASIGQTGPPAITVPIITSVPYTVIWPGIGMTYPNNTTLIGTEGFTIIQFPGQHTCIDFNYLVSENYCNLVFGIRDTNCQTTPICLGSPATFTASGGVTYTWSPATGLSNTSGSVVSANPSSYQTYTIIGTDANGCNDTAITSVTVNSLPVPTVSSFTNVSCFGGNNGAALVNVTNGLAPYHYLWTNGNTSVKDSMLIQGTYTLTVTDTNGCKGSISQLITQPALLKDSISDFSNLSCFQIPNGSATVGVRGGTIPYTYSWNSTPIQTTVTASNLPAGSYTATVVDANLCSTTATVTLTQPPALTLTATSTKVTCFGLSTGSATATASGGTTTPANPYTYAWSTTPPQISVTGFATGLAVGHYTAGVQDANGCTDTVSITITQPALLVDSIVSFKNDSCFGTHNGKAVTGSTGGTMPYTYSWSTTPPQSTANASNLPVGTYTATLTDVNGCQDTTVVTISQPTLLKDSIVSFKNDSCFGDKNGNAIATGTGGTRPYLFLWNSTPIQSDSIASNLPRGNYTVTVTDINGCVATKTVTITQPPLLTVSSAPQTICISKTATLTANSVGGTAPYGYLWNNMAGIQTNTVNPTTTTTYSVKTVDTKGCKDSNTVTVFVRKPLSFLAVNPGVEKCNGLSDTLNATGFGGDSLYIYNWAWNSGSFLGQSLIVNPTSTTVYTLTLTDICGTSPSATTTVREVVDSLPQINFSVDKKNGCYPLCVQFANTTLNAIAYNWSDGRGNHVSTDSIPAWCYNAAGIFTVKLTATSNKGCVSKDSILNMITVYNHPKAQFYTSPDSPTIIDPAIQFTDASSAPGSSITNLFWQTFGDATDSTSIFPNPTHTYNDTGTYCITLIATNTFGCKDTTTKCIFIKPYFTLYIPSAFTPNGDGDNDVFTAVGDYIFGFDMKIFDRWGNLVYHSTHQDNGWNGSLKGGIALEDVYVYIISATDYHNHSYSYKGTVTLLK